MRSSRVGAVALLVVALVRTAFAQDPATGIPACEPVQKAASGLQWCVLAKGRDEPPPGPDDTVRIHYTGWLESGKKFGSSRDLGKPTSVSLRDVHKGWTEGIQLMPPGAKYKFVVPPDLAFGDQGAPGSGVPPKATVVYEIELLGVVRRPKLQRERLQTLENGVKYEVAVAGTGAAVKADAFVSLRFAIWTAAGALWDHTDYQNVLIRGVVGALPPPVNEIVKAVPELKVGDVVRAEVPAAVYAAVGGDSVWELEVVSAQPKPEVPQFRLPDRKKLVTTQTGLEYEVITMGSGASPKRADTVLVQYTGWFEDGRPFESSHERGAPAEIKMTRVIAGWAEGLQLMKPGSTFLFRVPSGLAYGGVGREPDVPANTNLVFWIELVGIVTK